MKTILIIDDEAHVRMLYTEELQQQGYVVVGSDGSVNPLALVAEHKPDLIILDIKLGGKSGLDLLQTIRQKHPKLPVILSTAYDSFRFDMKSVAADAYVVKSYDSSELIAKVRVLAPL
ncbi:MAG: response regulator [Deltaproteobacteria bacterium]|nr:response regulator [Deltaproteobacteria bacterium]